ncbi:ABC transporter permease [Paralcaligenes ureilyticus]|uniref:Peptide/nickel transport system permease protein n=1 Tax=Paralcaligenes ureilyticus TaxID=627131 RepID=A0A4R3LT98_9BURK|nr:ABC transporter permease [Paralcaligenes ureilyticus]TCT03086.1 peptide/nickel transport system permease protein [Paralcaligenes ureilyticus]
MTAYVTRRFLSAMLTLLGVAVILFILFRMMPGDPTAQVISPALDEAAQIRLKHAFGLDLPMWQQFIIYLKNLVTFEWGRSFTSGQPVANLLGHWLFNTLLLMSTGLILAIAFGVVLGVLMAARRGGILDNGATVVGLVCQAAPPFVIGILLLMGLSYQLDMFPTGGMFTPGTDPGGSTWALVTSADFLEHLFLPTLTITALYMTTPMLVMRDSMLEVLGSDFVEFARAKGLSPNRVLFRHAARNALLAVVTVSSLILGFAIGGQIVIETVFSWPGLGKAMVDAALQHDYPVAQAAFFVMAAVVIGLNFITDLSYSLLDPRIRIGTT